MFFINYILVPFLLTILVFVLFRKQIVKIVNKVENKKEK
jgi:hypothetical protein